MYLRWTKITFRLQSCNLCCSSHFIQNHMHRQSECWNAEHHPGLYCDSQHEECKKITKNACLAQNFAWRSSKSCRVCRSYWCGSSKLTSGPSLFLTWGQFILRSSMILSQRQRKGQGRDQWGGDDLLGCSGGGREKQCISMRQGIGLWACGGG